MGIVDDHPVIIAGTVEVLSTDPNLEVVSVAPTVPSLLAQCAELDVVLLDLQLNDTSTPTTNIRTLTERRIPAIAFTSGDRPALIREAARAGAIGMIRKTEEPEAIIAAVHAGHRGETVASTDWAASLDDDQEFVSGQLSDREAEVLALYATGETAERVGTLLYISRSTVIEHVKRIRKQYAASGRPARTKHDLFIRAVEDGIIEPGFPGP
ncbi:MAG: response regulator [Leucobacter sp.]